MSNERAFSRALFLLLLVGCSSAGAAGPNQTTRSAPPQRSEAGLASEGGAELRHPTERERRPADSEGSAAQAAGPTIERMQAAGPTIELMRAVKRDLKRGDAEALRSLIGEGPITIELENSSCDERCVETQAVRGYPAFQQWLEASYLGWAPSNCDPEAPAERARQCLYYAGFVIQGRMACDDACCRIAPDPEFGLPHHSLFLEAVCFARSRDGDLHISSIHLLEG